ncbi:MAG: hypothetical protein HZA54_12435 [Planctomycetes bacterium]|nr:hypothetical protein [Planctomycetota bacterium]
MITLQRGGASAAAPTAGSDAGSGPGPGTAGARGALLPAAQRRRRRGPVLVVALLALAAAGHWAWPSTPPPAAAGSAPSGDPEVAAFKRLSNRLHGQRARLEREFSTETAQQLYSELEQALAAQQLPGFRKTLTTELDAVKEQMESRAATAWAEVRRQIETLQKAGNARAALAALGRFPPGLRSFDSEGHSPTRTGTECAQAAEALGVTLRAEDPERAAAGIQAALDRGDGEAALELADQAVARTEGGTERKSLEAQRLQVLGVLTRPLAGTRLTAERLGVLHTRLEALGRRYAGDEAVRRHLAQARRELDAGLAAGAGTPGGPARDLVTQLRPLFRRRDLVGVRRLLKDRFDPAAQEGASADLLADPSRQEALAQVLGDSPYDITGADLASVAELASAAGGRDAALTDALEGALALALLEELCSRAERALVRCGEEPWLRVGVAHRVLSRPAELRIEELHSRTDRRRWGILLNGEWLAVAPRGADTLTSDDVLRLAGRLPSPFPAELATCAGIALRACEGRAPAAAPIGGGAAAPWRKRFDQVMQRIGSHE